MEIITTKKYRCSICKSVYKTEEECIECENSHIPVEKIVRSSFFQGISEIRDGGKYAYRIDVLMKDGKIGTYEFERIKED